MRRDQTSSPWGSFKTFSAEALPQPPQALVCVTASLEYRPGACQQRKPNPADDAPVWHHPTPASTEKNTPKSRSASTHSPALEPGAAQHWPVGRLHPHSQGPGEAGEGLEREEGQAEEQGPAALGGGEATQATHPDQESEVRRGSPRAARARSLCGEALSRGHSPSLNPRRAALHLRGL